MNISLIIIIGLYRIISSDGRLIIKNSKTTIEIKTKSTPSLRIARDVPEDDTAVDFSKIDTGELIHPYNIKSKYCIKYKFENNTPDRNIPRVSRRSSEKITNVKNGTYIDDSGSKQKLVKKPIPKFTDTEDGGDFQDKLNKIPVSVANSDEHEDEDFNLSDYDFDVNHDEFAGRGKPLEPINRVKEANDLISNPSVTTNTKPADTKIQSKSYAAKLEGSISNKRERAIAEEKVSNRMIKSKKEDEYCDDKTIKETKETKSQILEDEAKGLSKEFERKIWSFRTPRSLWNISYKVESRELNSAKVSKVQTSLPMFPQVPYDRQLKSDAKYSIVP